MIHSISIDTSLPRASGATEARPASPAAPSSPTAKSALTAQDVYGDHGTPAPLGDWCGTEPRAASPVGVGRPRGDWCGTEPRAASPVGVGRPLGAWCGTEPRAASPVSVRSLTTDSAFRIGIQDDEATISVGIGAGIDAAGGSVGFEVAGRSFTVSSRAGEDAFDVLTRLRAEIEKGGVKVKVEYPRTIDTLIQVWKFSV